MECCMDEFEDGLTIRDFSDRMGFSETKVRRLIKHGCEAIDGRIVRLGTFITEAGMKTSVRAYKRFLQELNQSKEESNE